MSAEEIDRAYALAMSVDSKALISAFPFAPNPES